MYGKDKKTQILLTKWREAPIDSPKRVRFRVSCESQRHRMTLRKILSFALKKWDTETDISA